MGDGGGAGGAGATVDSWRSRSYQPRPPGGSLSIPRFALAALLSLCGGAAALPAQNSGCPIINQDDSTGAVNATPPRHLRGPIPVHPATAKARRDGGVVELIFVVGCDGRVDASSVTVRSASDSVFIAPAVTAMIATQYSPAEAKGKKVAMRVMQRVTFDADVYHTREGKAISVAEAELLAKRDVPGCPVLPLDPTRKMPWPGLEPVQYLGGAAPRYPKELKGRGIEGKVQMRFIVGCDGKVEPESFIIIGFTDTAFVGPAITAMQSAKFSPAKQDGKKVAQVVEQAIRWALSGETRPMMPSAQPWWVSTCRGEACRSSRP